MVKTKLTIDIKCRQKPWLLSYLYNIQTCMNVHSFWCMLKIYLSNRLLVYHSCQHNFVVLIVMLNSFRYTTKILFRICYALFKYNITYIWKHRNSKHEFQKKHLSMKYILRIRYGQYFICVENHINTGTILYLVKYSCTLKSCPRHNIITYIFKYQIKLILYTQFHHFNIMLIMHKLKHVWKYLYFFL